MADQGWANQFDQFERNPPLPQSISGPIQAAPSVPPWQRSMPPLAMMTQPLWNGANNPTYAALPRQMPQFASRLARPEQQIYSQPMDQELARLATENHAPQGMSETPQEEHTQGTVEEEAVPDVDWREGAPDDLASVLAVPPTVPEVLPLRPGATAETIPRQGMGIHRLPDQSNITMSDSITASSDLTAEAKQVRFGEAISAEQRSYSGVPSSLEEALAHSTTIPGASSSWEDPLVTDLSDFDEDAFMAFNGGQSVAQPTQHAVAQQESLGQLQRDWDEFQRDLPESGQTLAGGQRGANGLYLFQSRNPFTEAVANQTAEEKEMSGRESPTLKVSDATSLTYVTINTRAGRASR